MSMLLGQPSACGALETFRIVSLFVLSSHVSFFYGGQVPFVCYLFNFVFLVFSNSYFTENQHKNLIFFCCMGALILNFVLSSMLEYHAREIVAADNTDV